MSTNIVIEQQQLQSSCNNSNTPTGTTIRHSGYVYVRGRIRRVWRPRYIELSDDGKLFYYEKCTPPTTTTSSSSTNIVDVVTKYTKTGDMYHHSHDSTYEYKYTLLITGARILDVTTIRDLHTGLPRGTFGFVLRGQRYYENTTTTTTTTTTNNNNNNQQQQQPDTMTSDIITSNNNNMTDSFVFAAAEDDIEPISSSLLLQQQTQQQEHTIRDYLCAVTTLEDAQMWVVALQWASSININIPTTTTSIHTVSSLYTTSNPTTRSNTNTTSMTKSGAIATTTTTAVVPTNTITSTTSNITKTAAATTTNSSDHWWKVDYNKNTNTTINVSSTSSNSSKDETAVVSQNYNDKDVTNTDTGTLRIDDTEQTNILAKSDRNTVEEEKMKGKILVTAVTGYTVVRNTTFTFDIAYTIHAMLLYYNNNNNNTNNNTNERYTETWSMQRTLVQFQNIASELFQYRNGTSSMKQDKDITTSNDTDTDSILLQRLYNTTSWTNRPTIHDVEQSVSILDSILRSWILSSDLVNTNMFKQFLGLQQQSSSSSKAKTRTGSFFQYVHSTNPFSIIDKVTEPVPNHIASDVYVRGWLQSLRRKQSSDVMNNNTNKAGDNNNKNTLIGILSSFLQIPKQEQHDDDQYQQQMTKIAIQLRHQQTTQNMLYVGGAAIVVFGMIPVTIVPLIRRYITIPHITIRLDYLLASWAGFTYLGQYFRGRFPYISFVSDKQLDDPNIRDRMGTMKSTTKKLSKATRHYKADFVPPTLSSKSLISKKSKGVVDPPDSPKAGSSQDDSAVIIDNEIDAVQSGDIMDDFADFVSTTSSDSQQRQFKSKGKIITIIDGTNNDIDDDESDGEASTIASDDPDGNNRLLLLDTTADKNEYLSSPLPKYSDGNVKSCWSQPSHDLFHVRGVNYLRDKVKVCSGPSPFKCRGVDIWITDNPERHIARHPSVLGGKLHEVDTFLVNFLLPFGNFVSYFEVPPLASLPDKLRTVWTKFLKGDQQYRDARLKLLPVVVDGPWIVKTAVGPGKSPALLGKVIPLQYFFCDPDISKKQKGIYEVDVIITASTIAKSILSIVKSQTKSVSIAFAFIIEASEQSELPETVLCSFQIHSIHLDDCPYLPPGNLD